MYNQIKTTNNYLEVLCCEAGSTLTEETNKYKYTYIVCVCVCVCVRVCVLTSGSLCRRHRSSSQTFRSAGREKKPHFQKRPVLKQCTATTMQADLK